jgi:cytochrome b561
VAGLIALTVPIGFWMSDTYAAAQKDPALEPRLHLLSAVHHTIGFTILALVGVWAAARLAAGGRAASRRDPPWRDALARTVHAILLLLLIVLPLSGWAALSAFGDFPIYFGGYHMPGIVPRVAFDAAHGYAYYAQVHRWSWKAGAALLGLHVAAALWHQFVVRDGVLSRMWSGNRSRAEDAT